MFSKEVGFKKYLHGVSNVGSRLLLKFRSGTHGLNAQLDRHGGREGKVDVLCVVLSVRVLCMCCWDARCRLEFLENLQEIL